MSIKLVQLGILGLCVFGCTHKNPTAPGEDELTPSRTTRTSQRSQSGPLTGRESETVESIASIVDLDYDSRRMTVRNSAGAEESFVVRPEVQRLNELKIGDKVAVQHSRSVAFEVRPPTKAERASPRTSRVSWERKPLNVPPGVRVDTLKRVIVTILDIDEDKNAVTVRTPEGEQVTFNARNPNNLARAKVGDTVAVTYGESTAIDVKPLT